jgi:hypothetical protein
MTSRRLWVPVLVALLVATLIGPGMMAGAEPRVTVTKTIMIPAAAFNPGEGGYNYLNDGYRLVMPTGGGVFIALLDFPVPEVNIKKITLYARDTGLGGVCVELNRVRPATGSEDVMGSICTSDSAANPQVVYTTAISPRQVDTAFQGAYLAVSQSYPSVNFYGVKITYSYEG